MKKKSKFKKDQLAVLTEDYASCACSAIKKNTIVKIVSTPNGDSSVRIARYLTDSDFNYIPEQVIRPLKAGLERSVAKRKFEASNRVKYASINA